ncbi:MAG: polyprenyl synthetase family protein [Candidatus Hydrogenedentes bacterium]|nr:polyprenyl synthetase family protein [Candidatus Hydrogenedentota bacterium]
MSPFNLASYLAERKLLIDRALDERLPSAAVEPRHVHEAMRYATLGGGKRLRAILALSVADLANAPFESVLDSACAIEFVHTASLILDDLPSMDDADTRRDIPSTHVRFGEASALLASVALIAQAFELVARNAASSSQPEVAALVTQSLAQVIGTQGAIYGQHLDLGQSEVPLTLEAMEDTYRRKASALFAGGLTIPATLVGMSLAQREALNNYALELGLAFQITDDLIDAGLHGEESHKITMVTHLGEEGAHKRVSDLVASAEDHLRIFGDAADPLRMMARYVATRKF